MKNVTVVGVGALGSNLVLFLRSMKIKLKVIDFDRVEQKNVLSQFHSKQSVGKSKVQSLNQTMNFLFGLKLDVIGHKLTDDNVSELLSGSDLVVDCLDNGESRTLVQNFVRKNSIPCLHGALAADAQFGRSTWDENFKVDFTASGTPTCETGDQLPFIGVVACYLARSVQEFVTNGRKVGFEVSPSNVLKI